MVEAPLHHATRLTGMDQLVWNLTKDMDSFCIWALAEIKEPLKDHLIQQTLGYLIETIPVLHSKPCTNWFYGRWQFIDKDDVGDLIRRISTETDQAAQDQLNRVFLNPIDAQQLSMIRIISIDGPTRHYLVIQVHHLVVDGEGVKRICVRFAEIYQNLYHNPAWKPSTMLDPGRSWGQIAKNFHLHHLWWILFAYLANMYAILISILRKRVAYTLIGDTKEMEAQEAHTPPYFDRVTLRQDEMLAVKAFTKRKPTTVNDVLMASLALATKQWNQTRGDRRDWLKFGYTANLRRWWGEPKGTFGNFSVVLLFGEKTENLADPSSALVAIKSKVDRVKKRIGLDGFFILMQLKLVPYFLVQRLALQVKKHLFDYLKHCHAMTNIGIVYEEAGNFGHTQAVDYSLLAPTFPGGCIVYTVSTYKNVTSIYLGSDENNLNQESASRFLRLWKQKILEIIA